MMRKSSRCVERGFQTRKTRRRRSSLGPGRTMMTRSSSNNNNSTIGFLSRLPTEVLDMILDILTPAEISVFCMVSKEITRYVMNYISSVAWKNKMIVQSFHPATFHEQLSTTEHYRNLGLLFKRCTLLLPSKERLKFIHSRFSQSPCFLLGQCISPDCVGFSTYGIFLRTVIAGWDELECHRVFSFVCDVTNLLHKIEAVITTKPGVKWYQELQLRLFCRQVLLDPWIHQPENGFWLVQLLKPWPIVSQAHLLFILYGPLLPEGTLGWQLLVDRGQPHSTLWELASAILLLFGRLTVRGWTTDSMVAILEELIVIPQPWHMENVARLLVLCGSSLCYTILASKALSGRIPEISRILVYIILVCEKDGYHMKWAVRLVQQISKVFSTAPERFSFIREVENMFSDIIKEVFEFSVTGNHLERTETLQTLYILLDSSAHFHTKFLQMLVS